MINEARFEPANDVFFAAMVQIKKEGVGEMQHKEVISEQDLETLYCTTKVYLFVTVPLAESVL